MIAMIFSLPAGAQQKPVARTPQGAGPAKPFTQDQVQAMVRDGLGDETGAKAIEQRGIDFAPTEDFLQSLKSAGANEAFLAALRAAKHPQPAGEVTKKPLNQVQVFALLAGQVPSHRVAMLVKERGIDFEPTDEYLEEVRLGGGADELVRALKSAKVTKLEHADPALQARQTETWKHVASGNEFFRSKRYEDAETEYRAAIRLDPENPDLHVSFGGALESFKGDWDGAINEEQEALRLDPNNFRAHYNLGSALASKGDWDGAIHEYSEASRLDSEDELAHYGLGGALWRKGDWDGAIAEYREALLLNADNDMVHYNLGVALWNKGDMDDASAQYREALRLNPENDKAHSALGVALGQKGDWDGDIGEQREALRLDPNSEFAHYSLGFALEQKGDRQSALQEYRTAYKLNPGDSGYRQAYERLLKKTRE
jgi:tetratricopeptide (TPR) repeat protein